jgi:hypothetical protein
MNVVLYVMLFCFFEISKLSKNPFHTDIIVL